MFAGQGGAIDPLNLEACRVDLVTGALSGGRDGQLRPNEVALLRHLAAHAHRDVPRDELLAEVFDYRPGVRSRTVDTTVARLRAAIERDPSTPRHVWTVKNVGYRFVPLEAPSEVEAPPARFVGREADLERLARAVHSHPVVAVVGPVGVGTSALCAAYAARSGARFPGGRVREPSGDLAARGPVLVVWEGAAATATAWTASAPEVRVLLPGPERPPGLAVVEVGPLAEGDAARLALAVADELGVSLTPEGARRVAARAEGLPLAVRLWVGLLHALTVEEALGLDAPPGLAEVAASAVARAPDRQALEALAVIRGSFGLEEATAVLGPGAAATLLALRGRSLVARDGGGNRILGTIRAALTPSDPARYHRWLAAAASRRAVEVDGADALEALRWLEARRADLDAAVDTLEDPDLREAAALARDALLRVRGATEARVQALASLPASPAVQVARSQALREAGRFDEARAALEGAGDGADARVERLVLEGFTGTEATAEVALAAAARGPLDARQRGYVEGIRGHLAVRAGDLEEARRAHHASLQAWRSVGLERLAAGALESLAGPELLAGRLEAAHELLTEARDVGEHTGNRRRLGAVTMRLGIVACDLGRYDEAEAAYLETWRLEREDGRPIAAAQAMGQLALALHVQGRLERAERRYREAIAELRARDADGIGCLFLGNLGLLLWEEGRLGPARATLREALDLARRHRRPQAERVPRLLLAMDADDPLAALDALARDGALWAALRARVTGEREPTRTQLEALAPRSSTARLALRLL